MSSNTPPEADRRRPDGHDRRSSHTYIDDDGTLIFGDPFGARWRVYDRRSIDRRAGHGRMSHPLYRVFVNDAGEEWRCLLDDDEIIDETAVALEAQLERAVRHMEP